MIRPFTAVGNSRDAVEKSVLPYDAVPA